LNDRFQQAFTEQTATLSSTFITHLTTTKQAITQSTIPVGVDDTPKGEFTVREARIA
jgi:hypothetical protein